MQQCAEVLKEIIYCGRDVKVTTDFKCKSNVSILGIEVWLETLVRCRRLSCAVGNSRALSATLVRCRQLSCTLGDSPQYHSTTGKHCYIAFVRMVTLCP